MSETEWVEFQEQDFTVAFGRTGKTDELRIRVIGQKHGATAHIEWSVSPAWVRDLLDRWFPRAAAPRES